MTIGQLCFYDQVKGLLLSTPYFTDNLVTHFTSSLCAVSSCLTRKLVYSSQFPSYKRIHCLTVGAFVLFDIT